MTTTYRPKLGWKLGTLVFVVLPVGTYWLGSWIIWNVFGNGGYLPTGSTGDHLAALWHFMAPGPGIVVAILAAGVLFAFRIAPRVTLPLSALAGALTYGWMIVVLIAGLMLDPGALH